MDAESGLRREAARLPQRVCTAAGSSENAVKPKFAEQVLCELRRMILPETVWKLQIGFMTGS
jgi:hypothetical protein